MKKVEAYQAKNGKLYTEKYLACLADLQEMKETIENTWLSGYKNRMKILLAIEECFDEFKADLENYKKAYLKYQEFFKACQRKEDYANI